MYTKYKNDQIPHPPDGKKSSDFPRPGMGIPRTAFKEHCLIFVFCEKIYVGSPKTKTHKLQIRSPSSDCLIVPFTNIRQNHARPYQL